MTAWMRVGRRLEYFIAGWAVVSYMIGGFMLNRHAPPNIHVSVWLFWASFVFPFSFAGLLVGRWMRRRNAGSSAPATGTATVHPAKTRVLFYILAAGVTIPADRVWAKATGWSIGHILLADFAILGALIAITEIKERRKRRIDG